MNRFNLGWRGSNKVRRTFNWPVIKDALQMILAVLATGVGVGMIYLLAQKYF